MNKTHRGILVADKDFQVFVNPRPVSPHSLAKLKSPSSWSHAFPNDSKRDAKYSTHLAPLNQDSVYLR
jgi:hypothetical protein